MPREQNVIQFDSHHEISSFDLSFLSKNTEKNIFPLSNYQQKTLLVSETG